MGGEPSNEALRLHFERSYQNTRQPSRQIPRGAYAVLQALLCKDFLLRTEPIHPPRHTRPWPLSKRIAWAERREDGSVTSADFLGGGVSFADYFPLHQVRGRSVIPREFQAVENLRVLNEKD
jgi:hypothetical protein